MPEKDIHEGHRQRVKSRFLSEGLDKFAPHNILELLLFFGIPRMDTNEIAHALLNRFGSISEVLDAPYEELIRIKGISENAATLLKLIPTLARVYIEDSRLEKPVLKSPQELGEYFVDRFIGRTNEVVFLLCLDSALKAVHCELLTEGSLTSSNIDVRKIAECVIRHNVNRVALAHNHPRGLAVPSNNDVIVTTDLRGALSQLQVELVDHIIVAGGDYYSILEHYPNL